MTKKILFGFLFLSAWLLLSAFFISVDANATEGSFFGNAGNRINFTYKVVSANTLIKTGQGEIWSLDFQATSSNGTYTICDSTTIQGCGTQGLGIMAEGAQSTSGNSYSRSYGTQPVQTTVGIYAIVTNGTLIITYD
jgi:hypothetical protein